MAVLGRVAIFGRIVLLVVFRLRPKAARSSAMNGAYLEGGSVTVDVKSANDVHQKQIGPAGRGMQDGVTQAELPGLRVPKVAAIDVELPGKPDALEMAEILRQRWPNSG